MPASEVRKDDAPQEPSKEIEREKEKDKEKSSKSKGSTKTKDLSHVPCKFFKVGSCTAGSSCPFSHAILEPGQPKEVCAWFVKGNCKFGHKCALAHILPGQSMSMDRKNKKAAQAAASAANANGSANQGHRGGKPQKSNGYFVAIYPCATCFKTPDFASFGLPDESNKLPSAPAQGKASSVSPADEIPPTSPGAVAEAEKAELAIETGDTESSPRPTSDFATPKREGGAGKDGVDFGPIGSPPRAHASARIARVNGFSPGTSPKTTDLSSSPFSAPGTQSVFLVHEEGNDFKTRSGLSASMGALMSWGLESSGNTSIRKSNTAMYSINDEVVVEDGELEEFIPGSLTDLLTPEERSRRFSRTAASRPVVTGERESLLGQPSTTAEGPHHRYSRSVPAPSLLQDIRSIWSEAPEGGSNGVGITGGGLGNGTPNSFQSNSGFTARVDDIVAPSNASAAFLPGLHHFIGAKSGRSNLTAGMSSMYGRPAGTPASLHASGMFDSIPTGTAMSPSRLNSFNGTSTLDAISDPYAAPPRHPSGRPIHATNDGFADVEDRRAAFSPSTRALQAHAPGQSLPQGLAAGYSRIHALPPPPAIPSPSTSGAFSPGRPAAFPPATKALGHGHSGSVDWHSSSPSAGAIPESPTPQSAGNAQANVTTSSAGGLENMFSRLSYSAAASRANTASGPPGIASRNVSGRSWHNGQPQGPLSPLSGPVLTRDDDDELFPMDG
ncbi:hypothetical protein NM688_g6123 [Phlebia brevispora]|uniref:Uncharacterized protein n=1 Tax=Phlebia brevispora TaxID=194682 RepID=A0ACC1SJZ1_9APHY|nr:hypothetical protein NM688_g6123 [Phlebia brevispora]